MTRKRLGGVTRLALISALILSFSLAAHSASHKIRPGDTLWDIAKKYHTTPKALAHANGISENATLGLGKSISIPGKSCSQQSRRERYAKHSKRYAKSAGSSTRLRTTADGVCLRTNPGTNSSKITVLQRGTALKRLARKGNWVKVATMGGVCGYVYKPLVVVGSGAPVQGTACNAAPGRDGLIQTALNCQGARYRRGGTSRGGFDCSGFTRYVFAKYGIKLPHSSAAQAHLGSPVSRGQLHQGDLVFFQTYRRGISHVGIYVGNGKFVHAATYGRGVRVDYLNSGYYAHRYRGARRVR